MVAHQTLPAIRRGQRAFLAVLVMGSGGVPPDIFQIKNAIRAYLPMDDNLLLREKQISTRNGL
jgi:hypothetical protein